MSKLKPCPFCGGEGCIQRHEFVGYTDTFGIVCLDCGCETRQFYDTKKDVIELWNRRADDAPTIKTKQVKYYDDDEKVWKIGEVIANTLHDLTDSYKGSEYNGNIKD